MPAVLRKDMVIIMKQLLVDNIPVSVVLTRKKVKNINIRVSSDGTVSISAPYRIKEAYIDELIRSRSDFIANAVRRVREALARSSDESDKGIRYCGNLYGIDTVRGSSPSVIRDENRCVFIVTVKEDEPCAYEYAKAAVNAYIKKSAEELFTRMNADVHSLFIAHGYNVPLARIHIKDMKTRWGSLNPTKASLSINLRLMGYPVECARAVFCHEYAHFLHADHSKRFYEVLTQVCPDYKAVHRLLRD